MKIVLSFVAMLVSVSAYGTATLSTYVHNNGASCYVYVTYSSSYWGCGAVTTWTGPVANGQTIGPFNNVFDNSHDVTITAYVASNGSGPSPCSGGGVVGDQHTVAASGLPSSYTLNVNGLSGQQTPWTWSGCITNNTAFPLAAYYIGSYAAGGQVVGPCHDIAPGNSACDTFSQTNGPVQIGWQTAAGTCANPQYPITSYPKTWAGTNTTTTSNQHQDNGAPGSPPGSTGGSGWTAGSGASTNGATSQDIQNLAGSIAQGFGSLKGAMDTGNGLLGGILTNTAGGIGQSTNSGDDRLNYLTNLPTQVGELGLLTNLTSQGVMGNLSNLLGEYSWLTNQFHFDSSNYFMSFGTASGTNYGIGFGSTGIVVGDYSSASPQLVIDPFVGSTAFDLHPDKLLASGFSAYVRLVMGMLGMLWFARRTVDTVHQTLIGVGSANTGRVPDLNVVGINLAGVVVFSICVVISVIAIWAVSDQVWASYGGHMSDIGTTWSSITSAIMNITKAPGVDATAGGGVGIGAIVMFFLDTFFPVGLICSLIINDLALKLGACKALLVFVGAQRVIPG